MQWHPDIKELIDKALLEASMLPEAYRIAVFDADGTLWPGDIGESFFKFQIENKLAPGLKGIKDPWKQYKKLEETNPFEAYSNLLTINEGLHWSEMRRQTRSFISSGFDSISKPMFDLLQTLQKNRFAIWICSASMRWVLESLLECRGLCHVKLIGFEAQLDKKGRISNRIQWPMPYGEGKKEALSVRLKYPPLMSFGNSMGDFKLLEWAELLPMVIRYSPFNPLNIKTETQIATIAHSRGWPTQIFAR